MVFARTRSSRWEGHLSGGQSTRDPPVAAAGTGRRAGSVADPVLGDGGGDRAGRPARDDPVAGCGDRADQVPGSGVHRRAGADRAGVRAAGRGGLPGRAGPLSRRSRRAGARGGARVELDDRGRAGSAIVRRSVAGGGDRDRRRAHRDARGAARGAGRGAVRAGHDRPRHHRCRGLRGATSAGWRSTTRDNVAAVRTWPPGPRPRPCWLRT
jgi:hypothetical protein